MNPATAAQIRKFEEKLELLDSDPSQSTHPKIWKVVREAVASQLESLRAEQASHV